MGATRVSTPVTCELCGKVVSRKADLPRHMRTHAVNKEELMHACPYEGCDYKALQRSNVATHFRTHTGERPNKCPTAGCTYTTSDPGSLTRHRKSAHGYEPKAHVLSHPMSSARKAARQQRRVTPYSTSSSSSSATSSTSSPSSSSSSFDSFELSLPELAPMLCPTSHLADKYARPRSPAIKAKSASPAFNSALISEFSSFTSSFIAPIDPDFAFAFDSALLPSQEVPWVASSPQPLVVTDRPELPLYDVHFPNSTDSSIPDVNFAYSPLSSKDFWPASPVAIRSPPASGYVAPQEVDEFLVEFAQWQDATTYGPAPSTHFPTPEAQASFDDMPYTFSPEAQPSEYPSPESYYGNSFAVSPMGGNVFPEAIDLSYFDTLPSGMNEFFTNDFLAC